MDNSIGYTQEYSSTFSTIFSAFMALLFILILIYATLKVMKILNRRELFLRKSPNIELIESFVLSRNLSIYLIKISKQEMAIIENNNQIIVKEFENNSFKVDEPEEVNFSKLFSEKVKNFGKKKDDLEDD